MSIVIREMVNNDRRPVKWMMEEFYASNAIATNGSKEIFNNDINACISDNPYLEGYVFENDGYVFGYAMLAKSFSTEYGKPCIWIEDLYIQEQECNTGLGSTFFECIEKIYPDCIFRLEVEAENERAIHVYKKNGFDFMPYLEMKK